MKLIIPNVTIIHEEFLIFLAMMLQNNLMYMMIFLQKELNNKNKNYTLNIHYTSILTFS